MKIYDLIPGFTVFKAVMFLAIVAAIFGAGAYSAYSFIWPKLEAERAAFNQFKGGVAAVGLAAQAAAAKQALADLKAKERADENSKLVADRNALDIARLRADADRASGRGLPAAPAGSVCPSTLVCYDRAALERADRDLAAGIRARADSGTKVEINHREAVKWAN